VPANLLILPLLGGFLFVHICTLFKFRAQRLDGYRLLLYSSVAGTVLVAIARAIITIAKIPPVGHRLAESVYHSTPIPYLGTASVALLLGLALSYFLNLFFDAEKARAREILTHGDSLLRLFEYADTEEELVSITLDNRKWYVGFIAQAPNLEPSEKYFKILPVLSGYREKDTMQTIRTVSYEDALRKRNVQPSDFVIILPIADVKIANLFDPNIYDEQFAPRDRLIVVGGT
jgi:hypothetical protein